MPFRLSETVSKCHYVISALTWSFLVLWQLVKQIMPSAPAKIIFASMNYSLLQIISVKESGTASQWICCAAFEHATV
ncbi:hypothetical protein BDW62DRAFT_174342, partial [Aspergillus aurantiobrunneus]